MNKVDIIIIPHRYKSLECDSYEFTELAVLFRDDDFNTIAQDGPLDIVKNKLIRTRKQQQNTIPMDTKGDLKWNV